MNIILKQNIVILSVLISLSSFAQIQQVNSCTNRIGSLYSQQKIHLIFCSYYFEKVNTFSGADTILENLSFYRDTINISLTKKEDSCIIDNLKTGICDTDTSLITEMSKWCDVSKKLAAIRAEVNFTLEGYMEFLNSLKETSSIFSDLSKTGRTIYSLSTDEMEWIYFTSISIIKSLKKDEQNIFFKKLKSWDFI